MATTVITTDESVKYNENLLPTFAEFNENITWNVVEGGSNAVAENNQAKAYAGQRSLLFTFTGTGGIAIDKTDQLSFVAPQTGNYIISIRAYVSSTYDDADINFRIYSFINAVNTIDIDFNVDTSASGFVYDAWNTFYQVFPMEVGDIFDCQLKAQSTEIGSKIYLDGFKIEFDDRELGIPSRYMPTLISVADEVGTGWASYVDTVYTVGSPFDILEGVTSTLPNNAGTVIDDYLPTGVTNFYDQATQKITPENVGDFYSFSIRFKAKNNNIAGYFDFGIDIGGSLGIIFKETQLFLKGANTEQCFSITCNGYSLDTFLANGGQVKIESILGDMEIYDIQYQINRTFKA